jgi:predicted metal-dependent hydrolase
VNNKGSVRISAPWSASRRTIVKFVLSQHKWIKEQQTEQSTEYYSGMLFGKTLRLIIEENSPKVRSQQLGKDVIIHFSKEYEPQNTAHKGKIEKTMKQALRTEAEVVLLPRLREFADNYGFTYRSAGIKQVTGRWGSCDSRKNISLSLYLAQLPIEFLDYVLIHELSHTVHMNHGKDFWDTVDRFCPEYKTIRKKMRGLRPKIYDAKSFMA